MRKDDTQQCIQNRPKTLPTTVKNQPNGSNLMKSSIRHIIWMDTSQSIWICYVFVAWKFGLKNMVIKNGDYMHWTTTQNPKVFSRWDSRGTQANMLLIVSLKSIVTLKVWISRKSNWNIGRLFFWTKIQSQTWTNYEWYYHTITNSCLILLLIIWQ